MIRIRGDGVLTKGVYHHQSAAQAKQVKMITKMLKLGNSSCEYQFCVTTGRHESSRGLQMMMEHRNNQ